MSETEATILRVVFVGVNAASLARLENETIGEVKNLTAVVSSALADQFPSRHVLGGIAQIGDLYVFIRLFPSFDAIA